ncbi:type II toxin-antitoxin system RelE/ParE family toxin [Thermophilibacter immobilis]|jgi:Txe/YoeB family toxin of Txe-Axe toxin-antitoxin module
MWSRRIGQENRPISSVTGDELRAYSAKDHYAER